MTALYTDPPEKETKASLVALVHKLREEMHIARVQIGSTKEMRKEIAYWKCQSANRTWLETEIASQRRQIGRLEERWRHSQATRRGIAKARRAKRDT